MPSSDNRFILELDGFPAIAALDATLPSKAHTPFEHQPGNQAMPDLGRGNFKCDDLTLKHAHNVGGLDDSLARYFDLYTEGIITDKLNGRFMVMDESGLVPVKTYDIIDAVPTMFKPEQHTGTGTNVSSFSFGMRPTNFRLI